MRACGRERRNNRRKTSFWAAPSWWPAISSRDKVPTSWLDVISVLCDCASACDSTRSVHLAPCPFISETKEKKNRKRRRKWWTPCWSASSPCWHWDWLVPRQRRLCRNYWITARFLSRLHLLRLPYSPISPGWPYQLLLLLLLYRPVTLCRPATNRLAASSFRPPGNPSNSICLSV